MAVRWVIVDDTDPEIQYSGSWFHYIGQFNALGNFGSPFRGTSHGSSGNASASYLFTGSRVRAFGTSVAPASTPLSECFVDNISIGFNPPSSDTENNWIFCDSDSLADGEHNFTLQVVGFSYLDQIQYLPSAGMALDSALILVNASDSAIQYAGWQDMGHIFAGYMGYFSTLPNYFANMTFDFNGTSLQWFCLRSNDTTLMLTGTSYYSIDGAGPVGIDVVPTTSGLVLYNQLAFQLSNLSAGPHQLSVIYTGDNTSIPLTLNYLVIQNPPALVRGTSTSTSISSSPSSSSTLSNHNHKGSPTGAIRGGAIGGVAVVVAIILLLLLRRQRRRNSNQALNHEETLPDNIEPFNIPPTVPVSFRNKSAGGQLESSSSGVPTRQVPQHPSKFRTIPTGPRPLTSPNPLSNQSSGSPANHDDLTAGNPRLRETDESRELPSMILLSVEPEVPVASNSHSSDTAARVMQHEDSGVRLPARESVLEVPPLYTAL